jgi:hypothetical protein
MTAYLTLLLLSGVALSSLGVALHAGAAGHRAHRALQRIPAPVRSRIPHTLCTRCQRLVAADERGRPLRHTIRADRPYGPDCGPRVIR